MLQLCPYLSHAVVLQFVAMLSYAQLLQVHVNVRQGQCQRQAWYCNATLHKCSCLSVSLQHQAVVLQC